jgi:prepilin signal peptidase PulO-like enzyme (type II secretory pathway)
MENLIYLIAFVIFSANSVVEDILCFRIRLHEIALGISIILVSKAVLGGADWVDTIVGGCVGSIAFIIVKRFSKERLGAGDVWFSALIGFSFGFWTWDFGLLVAAFLGVLWTGILRLSGRRRSLRDIRIPFAPFMFIGAVAVSIYRGCMQ